MSDLCDNCGHELPNSVPVDYCTNCGEPQGTTKKTLTHIRKESKMGSRMEFENLRYAVLAVAIYRVVNDRWANGNSTMEELMFIFNEYEDKAVRDVVEALVEYGALALVGDNYTVVPYPAT